MIHLKDKTTIVRQACTRNSWHAYCKAMCIGDNMLIMQLAICPAGDLAKKSHDILSVLSVNHMNGDKKLTVSTL